MKIKNDFLEKLKTELIAPEVERIMKEQAPPPNGLEPQKVWEQKLRTNLMDLFSGEAVLNKMNEGFEAISENLTPVEIEKISEEWRRGVELWIEKSKSKEEKEPPLCLQEIMELSEETLGRFYTAGNYFFEHQEYHKASDIFYVIISLDPRRYNCWMALGLSEVHQQRWEPALISFSMASIMNIESPYPYLYSAECCLRDHRKEEAAVYKNLAKEAIENGDFKNKQELLNSLHRIQ